MILIFDDIDISLIYTEILGQRPKAGLAMETQNGSAAGFVPPAETESRFRSDVCSAVH